MIPVITLVDAVPSPDQPAGPRWRVTLEPPYSFANDKEVSSMAGKIPVGDMPEARASGMSGTAIMRSQRVSKIGVMDTLHAADEKDLSWEDVEGGVRPRYARPCRRSRGPRRPTPSTSPTGATYRGRTWRGCRMTNRTSSSTPTTTYGKTPTPSRTCIACAPRWRGASTTEVPFAPIRKPRNDLSLRREVITISGNFMFE